jgi:uncharacterized protein (TIGR02302 family)
MAAQQNQLSAPERAFERKIALSQCVLVFEQLWPRVWLMLALVGLFILVSMAGLWPRLGDVPHKLLLGAFALALVAMFIAMVRVRLPARDVAIRRVESASGAKHRPASSYEDTLTLGAEDARTAALWRVHRLRLAAMLQKLRVGRPSPRTDRHDPLALRVLLLLSTIVAIGVAGDSVSDRLRAAFRFGILAKGGEARLDAWVTPPAYTSRPPIMLANGAFHDATTGSGAGDTPAGPFDVPDRSVLIVRSSGGETLTLDVSFADAQPAEHVEGAVPANAADISEAKLEIKHNGTITAKLGDTTVAVWPFTVIPDLPPKITLTKDPERSPRGALKLHYKVEDDYGVVSAEARVRRLAPKADTSKTAWARPAVNKGPRPPLERPPTLALRLPTSYPKKAEGTSFNEIGDHPWAGMKVELTLIAKDLAGQTGRSETIEMVLPERRFQKPLARAVVEQRRLLVEDPRDRPQVARALEALTLAPEEFIEDLQVYLGLRSVFWRLQREGDRATRNSVVAQLWNVALRIEDGNLTDAERALRAAQEQLSKAIENGASDEEIQRLMQELRQALAQFLDQLQKQAQGQPPMQGMNPNQQFMTQQDLDQMLKNLENMARSGSRDMAQQMLSQLRDLLDRLQSGRMANQGQNQRMGQMMDEFGNIIGRQQKLLDDTFGQQRGQGQQSQGQQGQQGQQGRRGQQGQQGQGGQGDNDASSGLGDRQRELRDMLGHLQRGLRELGMAAPGQFGAAGEAMDRAERALRDGDLDGGAQEEGRALDQLRQGAREMAQQMLRQMPSRYGMNEGESELDPMGRPPQRTDGPDPGVGVKVPDEIDVQRAREILEELRRRLGEQTRPPAELDYLERLLKRF